MTRRPIVIVILALCVALTVLVLVGRGVLERDREALYAKYGSDRAQDLDEAAQALLAEFADIGEDLQLASTLVGDADSEQVAERELLAIATIKREYLAMEARGGDRRTRVVAYDAPPGTHDLVARALDEQLEEALRQPGHLHISGPLGAHPGAAVWYRVFARRPHDAGPAVAVAVDTTRLLSRMRVQRGPTLKVAVLDRDGAPATVSDRELARFVTESPAVRDALRARTSMGTMMTLDRATARNIGLPETTAVAVSRPLAIDRDAPWTLMLVASTSTLETQERVLVRRVLAGGGLVLFLLVSAAAYVIHNTWRAASLRERLRHVARLEHLTEKAEKIIDHIPSGVLTLSEDGRVTGTNRWLGERLGESVVGVELERAFATGKREDIEVVAGLVRRAVETREPQRLHRTNLRLFGQEAWLGVHAIPLARSIADVSVLLVLDDQTQLRRIEDRLLRSEKLVTAGQLAAGIAHEIGTPLNVARGRVELALSHLGDKHPEAENHRLVIDQIDRVTRLIQQLLDYVRPPAPMLVQSVEPARTAQTVKELLAAEAGKAGVALHVDVPADVPPLRADPDQLQQILVNLVLNAIAACEKGGRVDVRARRASSGIVIEVADTGHGIPREIQAQVFDPFFTTKKRGQGTGLGLWVVAQIVRAHAAEIEIDSAPEVGTTVRITWPVPA